MVGVSCVVLEGDRDLWGVACVELVTVLVVGDLFDSSGRPRHLLWPWSQAGGHQAKQRFWFWVCSDHHPIQVVRGHRARNAGISFDFTSTRRCPTTTPL